MHTLFTNLNANQFAAVNNGDRSTLVLAGPGSGKTRTLVARVAVILESTKSTFDRILALTFTNKAANEMLERLRNDHLDPEERCFATTFHSFACSVLRQHGHLVHISPDFLLVSENNERRFFIDSDQQLGAMIDSHFDDRNAFLSQLDLISRDGVSVSQLVTDSIIKDSSLRCVHAYIATLQRLNRVDLSMIVLQANQLLSDIPEIGELIRTQYTYVCVDEFQDSNASQMGLLTRIVDKSGNRLFVVADDDQLLYGWNGASLERFNELKRLYQPDLIQLPENYRCCPEILAVANKLILSNQTRNPSKKPLVAVRKTSLPEAVRCFRFQTQPEEHAWIVDDVKTRYDSGERRILILSRTNSDPRVLAQLLNERLVPARVIARRPNFGSPHMNWLQGLLRFLSAPLDQVVMSRFADLTFDVFSVRSSEMLGNTAEEVLRNWIAVHWHLGIVERISGSLTSVLESKQGIPELCYLAIEAIREVDGSHKNEHSLEFEEDCEALKAIVREVNQLYGTSLDLAAFNQELDMRSKVADIPQDCVQCMTIHGSKGLEFSHVYVLGMFEGGIPYYKAVQQGDTSREMEEERRGCFVAITRAEATLTMTWAQNIRGYRKLPSRFFAEMGFGWD